MWCGPDAVVALTRGKWTRNDVWLHARALMEKRGEYLPDVPRRGFHAEDMRSALTRAGFGVGFTRVVTYRAFRRPATGSSASRGICGR